MNRTMANKPYDNLLDLQIQSVESAWERTICKHWLCRKELTLPERLHGNLCIHHQRVGVEDPGDRFPKNGIELEKIELNVAV